MRRHTVPAALVWGVAAGVLAQAILAGLFLSGLAGARLVHTIVGAILPYYALVVAVVAAVMARGGGMPRSRRVAVYVLPFLLWLQEVFGHLPFAWATAVHVPLGVLLFAGAVLLAVSSRTRTPVATGAAEMRR